MRLKYKPIKDYEREVLDAVQELLGRMDIGITKEQGKLIITDSQGKELSISSADEINIKKLNKVMEKLE